MPERVPKDDKTLTTYIEVRFDFEGIHCWPAAPEEVAFLRDGHRHIFKARARIQVFHDDRELEFILVKRELEKLMSTGRDWGATSCESMCRILLNHIVEKYGDRRRVEIEVSEDGENGAVVVYE